MKKLLFALFLSISTLVHAWEPTKPVTMVIAYGPGSGNEILFRKLSDVVKRTHGINFVLDFRPGANELVGMNHFATAANDGYTLYAPGVGVWFATPVWYKKNLTQDPAEWEPVISLGEAPIALFARTDSTVNTPADFATALKTRKVDVGVGAPVMVLAYEYMAKAVSATNSQRVMFNSPAAAVQAVAGSQVEFGIAPLSVGLELARAGKLKLIGTTGDSSLGNTAQLADTFKGLTLVAHAGVVLPKDTPKQIVEYYHRVFAEAVATDEYRNFIKGITWYDSLKTPAGYQKFIASQRKQWIPVAESIPFN